MRNRRPFPDDLHTIFKQLDPQTFQQFVQAQQRWTMLQRMAELETHIDLLQEELAENDMQLKWLQPSAIALAAIARFQAYGVDDLDLLDTMLERGETWLDQTLQLLEQCERLGLIGDSYTAWSEHALEGAYDWIASMHSSGEDAELTMANALEGVQQNGHQEFFTEITEEMLIRRLMSEDETEKLAAILPTHADSEEDVAAPIEALSIDELVATHTQPVTETLAPADSVAASESAQVQLTSSDMPATPEILTVPANSVEGAHALEVPANSDMPAATLATPETLVASEIPVEAADTSEMRAVPDISDEALDTPEALIASDIAVEVSGTPEVLAVSDTSAETPDTPEALATVDTIIETSDVPKAVTISDTEGEASVVPVETSNASETLETLDTPDEKLDALEVADEPLGEFIQADTIVISDEASTSWKEHEAAVETLEPAEMFDESPMEAEPVAFVASTIHEHDALDDVLEHAAQPGVEERTDLFNEYIETVKDPRAEPTNAVDDQGFDTTGTHVEAMGEDQHDPFTVDGTVTYLPTGDAGVQAVPDTSIGKPRRRFFLWRLLARIFRRSPKKTS